MGTQYIPSKWRQRILSDESIKFFWSLDDNIEHFKTCTLARAIPDSKLKYSGKYDSGMKQCPECAARSYIEAYAQDPEEHKAYEKAFKEMYIGHKALRRMYIDCEISTRRASDGIYLMHNGELWKIIKGSSEQGHIRLFHNNYYMKDGEKIKLDGFHEQIKKRNFQNIDNILVSGA